MTEKRCFRSQNDGKNFRYSLNKNFFRLFFEFFCAKKSSLRYSTRNNALTNSNNNSLAQKTWHTAEPAVNIAEKEMTE
jgi:hypothetical protein